MRNLIRNISKTKTVILSTHIMQEVEALCDRVILIHKGAIRYDGSIAALSGSSRCINLSISGIEEKNLLESLRNLPGMADSIIKSNKACEEGLLCVTVESKAKTDLRPEIFQLALREGFIIYEMVRERTSMEDIFRQLTSDQQGEGT